MILYSDNSALVKIYVEEDDALRVRKAVSDAELVGTSEIHTLRCGRHWHDAIATARSSGRQIVERIETLSRQDAELIRLLTIAQFDRRIRYRN